jgi:hypothetical protein
MSQQTFLSGGTQVAEPPAPVLPEGDSAGAGDSRRKLAIVGAAVGVLVLAIVAYFLMKGGSSSNNSDSSGFVPPHHHHVVPAAAAPVVVKLPKHVVAPVGRDPFKALYIAPAAAAAAPATGATQPTQSTGGSTTTTSSGGTSATTTSTPAYRPVWIQLKSFTSTAASFDVGYSNGKTLKAVRYTGVKPLRTFASSFELLSIRGTAVNLKFGDGSPFQLDKTHNTMVVG